MFVPRRLAILERRQHQDGSYYYRISDGDAKGKPSPQGLLINGRKRQAHDLANEDVIVLAPGVRVKYYQLNRTFTPHQPSMPVPTSKPQPINPSIGGLYVQTGEQKLVFPLKHTEVQAKIAGNVSRVEVTQTFENPFTEPLEAIYVFPLPNEAAVDDMEIRISDAFGRQRIIKGNIKKREEAVAIYEQAKRQGHTAGLLEQERDNIFTQSLANIKPGEQIDVTIRYTDSLKFEGGNYEFVFPMVVGPRFIPGTAIDESGDTDQVPDASRITPPVIPPETRSGHDIGVTVEIDAGVAVSDVRSTSHSLKIEHDGQIVRVRLGGEDTIPNKDLILRYRVAGDNTQATVLNHSDERGGHFAIYLIPALDYRSDEIVAKDVVFLMDTSGSQHGDPLLKSQELMRRFINGLNPDDTFTIIDFSDITTQLSPQPLPNTPQNRTRAIHYINQLQANGGTYLLNGIRAVLNFPAAAAGRLRSIVLLTDGYIGNENEVLAEVQRELKPGNRLYSFGVGSSVNRFLLNRIAEIGRGTSQVVRHDEATQEVAEKFFRQINNPVLTNIQVSWDGTGEAPVIYPSIAPDLFAEQPLVLFGRKQDCTPGNLHITGIAAGGHQYEKTFNLTFEETGNPAIAQLWGRARIKDQMKQMFGYETKAGVDAVTQTALTYQLLSQYTAFVAVSEDVRVDPEDKHISMQVPVEMPEGVSYQGISGRANVTTLHAAAPSSAAWGFKSSMPAQLSSSGGYAQASDNYSEGLIDAYDVTLIDPSMVDEDVEASESKQECFTMQCPANLTPSLRQYSAAKPTPLPCQLQVLSATGLDQAAIASLIEHLQHWHLPSGLSGEIVFEFPVRKSRVVRVVFDEDTSTFKETQVIEIIKRSLQAWRVPQSVTGTVRLTLRIQS
jgi:Ca-activated chloride channel family protein